jgi:cytoskeletal protein CcmA (bactofilin family)
MKTAHNRKGALEMFGRRKDQDGTAKTAPEAAESTGPRMYRADTPASPAARGPVVDATARRVPDVTATTGRRAEVRPSPAGDADGRKLIVGREIALSGEIRACDRLVVEGRVEAVLSDSRAIEVSSSGVFKGKAQIESAEISGVFEGDLVVREKLIIHSSGRVQGNIRYGQIEIERGGVIAGQIDVLSKSGSGESVTSGGEAVGTAAAAPSGGTA